MKIQEQLEVVPFLRSYHVLYEKGYHFALFLKFRSLISQEPQYVAVDLYIDMNILPSSCFIHSQRAPPISILGQVSAHIDREYL